MHAGHAVPAIVLSLDELDPAYLKVDVVVLMAGPDEVLDWPAGVLPDTPRPGVLLLSDSEQHIAELAQLAFPAWGVLPMDFSEAELMAAVYAIDSGLITIAPGYFSLLGMPNSSNHNNPDEIPVTLTTRELEVLNLLSVGLANKQISLELGISEHTVKFHLSSIYQKLNVSNRAVAVRLGIQLGFIMV